MEKTKLTLWCYKLTLIITCIMCVLEQWTSDLQSIIKNMLAYDLSEIYFDYRVSSNFDAVLHAIDKDFSLPAHYPIGHDNQFKHWLSSFHPGASLVPLLYTMGSRQDIVTKGAAAAHKDNILQINLVIVLCLMEYIALSHFCNSSCLHCISIKLTGRKYSSSWGTSLVHLINGEGHWCIAWWCHKNHG